MKVVHILNELKFSGAEIMYVDAAEKLKSLGCSLYVINTNQTLGEYAPFFAKSGYKVIHMPYPQSVVGRFKFYNKLIDFLRKEQIDVVHIHASNLKWGASYCAWRTGIKSVYTFHSTFPIRWFSLPYQIFLRWSSKNIFGCRFQSISDDVYRNELKTFHNHTTLVYNWYGKNRFRPASKGEKEVIRKTLGISQNALVIISVGGCSGIKRHQEIIKALPLILKSFPETIYLHLGDGYALNDEKKLAEELGVVSHIRFEGNQTDVRRYLIASDIYVMTSKFEGISLTTIEALGCEIPAVLYDVPGLRTFSKCSILIPESHEILAKTVVSLFQNNEQKSELQKKGKHFVDSKFDLDKNVVKIFELYK